MTISREHKLEQMKHTFKFKKSTVPGSLSTWWNHLGRPACEQVLAPINIRNGRTMETIMETCLRENAKFGITLIDFAKHLLVWAPKGISRTPLVSPKQSTHLMKPFGKTRY